MSENVLLTVYCVVFGGVNSLRSWPPSRVETCTSVLRLMIKLFVHLLVISVFVLKMYPKQKITKFGKNYTHNVHVYLFIYLFKGALYF
jgi:hypothetical protein